MYIYIYNAFGKYSKIGQNVIKWPFKLILVKKIMIFLYKKYRNISVFRICLKALLSRSKIDQNMGVLKLICSAKNGKFPHINFKMSRIYLKIIQCIAICNAYHVTALQYIGEYGAFSLNLFLLQFGGQFTVLKHELSRPLVTDRVVQ